MRKRSKNSGGTARYNAQSLDQTDNSNANTTSSPLVSDSIRANGENNTENVAPNEKETDNWSEDNPSVQNFKFNEESGIKMNVPANASPAFFFELFVTEKLLQDLVTKTNEYADKTINKSRPLHRRSNYTGWKDVTMDEMMKFIGITFAMGLIPLPSYKKYWSTFLPTRYE